MSEKLLAYHGSKELKAEVIADMKADIEAERLISGRYWDGEKGCHVGCVLHARSRRSGISVDHEYHSLYEHHIGVPSALAHLFDALFESLPDGRRQQFSLDVLNAIAPGADLSDVVRQWLIWLLLDVRNYAKGNEIVLPAINKVVFLLEEEADDAASDAARAAACDAAWVAASDAAWVAACDAARAAASDAAKAAASDAAKAAACDAQSGKLLELLSNVSGIRNPDIEGSGVNQYGEQNSNA